MRFVSSTDAGWMADVVAERENRGVVLLGLCSAYRQPRKRTGRGAGLGNACLAAFASIQRAGEVVRSRETRSRTRAGRNPKRAYLLSRSSPASAEHAYHTFSALRAIHLDSASRGHPFGHSSPRRIRARSALWLVDDLLIVDADAGTRITGLDAYNY